MFIFPKNLDRKSRFFKSFPRQCLLKKIRKTVSGIAIFQEVNNINTDSNLVYHEAFAGVFQRHLEQEFEVQLRDGKVSEASREVIKALSEDYQILQVEERIDGILNDKALRYVGGSHLLNLLQPVIGYFCIYNVLVAVEVQKESAIGK